MAEIRSRRAAGWTWLVAWPVLVGALPATWAGCSSQSSKIVVPEAKDVPPPSSERGEAIDPSTYKRVKVE